MNSRLDRIGARTTSRAREILDERSARGEIDAEEYKEKVRDLDAHG